MSVFNWLREPDLNRRSGLALRLCPAPCLCKAKCLPSFFGRFSCHRQRSLEALRVMRTRFEVRNGEASDQKAGTLLRSHRRITDEISKTSFLVSSDREQSPRRIQSLGQLSGEISGKSPPQGKSTGKFPQPNCQSKGQQPSRSNSKFPNSPKSAQKSKKKNSA